DPRRESPSEAFILATENAISDPRQHGEPRRRNRARIESMMGNANYKEIAIKGPSARTRFNVRRVWVCPLCQRQEWTLGKIVHKHRPACLNHKETPAAVSMHLIEAQRRPRDPDSMRHTEDIIKQAENTQQG